MTAVVFLSQITVASILGPLVQAIGSKLTIVLFASIVAFMSSIVSAVFVIYEIRDEEEEENNRTGRYRTSKYSDDEEVDERTPLLNS